VGGEGGATEERRVSNPVFYQSFFILDARGAASSHNETENLEYSSGSTLYYYSYTHNITINIFAVSIPIPTPKK
jgi:hypothetical protein